jgi:hypothetical protein
MSEQKSIERAVEEMQAAEPLIADFMRRRLADSAGFADTLAEFYDKYGLRGALRAVNHWLEGGAYDEPFDLDRAIMRLAAKLD